ADQPSCSKNKLGGTCTPSPVAGSVVSPKRMLSPLGLLPLGSGPSHTLDGSGKPQCVRTCGSQSPSISVVKALASPSAASPALTSLPASPPGEDSESPSHDESPTIDPAKTRAAHASARTRRVYTKRGLLSGHVRGVQRAGTLLQH